MGAEGPRGQEAGALLSEVTPFQEQSSAPASAPCPGNSWTCQPSWGPASTKGKQYTLLSLHSRLALIRSSSVVRGQVLAVLLPGAAAGGGGGGAASGRLVCPGMGHSPWVGDPGKPWDRRGARFTWLQGA